MSKLEWECVGCGKPSPNKKRSCDCTTDVIRKGKKLDWKYDETTNWRESLDEWWPWRKKVLTSQAQEATEAAFEAGWVRALRKARER